MAGILDELTREIGRQLDADYARVKSIRDRPSPRRNIDRDAMRLVLRECLGCSLGEINVYEAGEPITLKSGQTFSRRNPEDGDAQSYWQDDDDEDNDDDDEGKVLDRIDQSIRNLAIAAEVTLTPKPRGRRPDSDPQDDPTFRDYLA